jgi:archaellum component FlaG (FlaF/FlaG flagellin family)
MLPHQQPPGWYPDPRGVPGQAYWDGQQWQFPPAKRKSSRWTVIAILFGVVVAAVGILYMSAVGQKAIQKSHSTQSSGQSAAPPTPQQPTHVKLNQEARDGNLSFVVTAVDMAQQTATVHVTVKNVGNRPTVFWADNQRLWIGDKWLVPDKAAASKAGASNVKLDPGKSDTVVLSFGVPAGSTAVDKLELHDASVSAGVTVEPRP